jgi:hypothetical protein
MTCQAPTKPARRWVSVFITHPLFDTPTEGVIAVRPGLLPAKLHLTSGPRPSADALAVVVALCGMGRASYAAFQAGDGSVVEVAAIARHRGNAGLEASTMTVTLPKTADAREVLAEGPLTLVA